MKKAQLAVETLLIYGIALLVVMGAIFALIRFGVLDTGSLLPDVCDMGELTCESYLVTSDGVQFEFTNTLQNNIGKVNITVVGEDNYEGLWQCGVTNVDTLIISGEVSNPIKVNCNVQVPRGKKIEGTIYANVTFKGLQIPRPIVGKIRTKVV